VASARASSTRWRSPPDSSGSRRSAQSAALGERHRARDRRLVGRPRRAEQAGVRQPAQRDRLARRQLAAGVAALRQPGDRAAARVGRPVGERAAVQPHLATVRRAQPGEHAQQRRLAGAVGPDDGGPAGAERRADAAQHRPPAERELQVLGLQQRVGSAGVGVHRQPSRRRCSSHSR
jgi:hypothetical protein